MTITFDNLFVSILKEKYDLILFVQPIGSYVNDGFRDMTMADEEIRTSFQLPRPIAPAATWLKPPSSHPDYLSNYEEAKKVIDTT